MPYTYTATAERVGTYSGRGHHLLTVTESGVTANTDEWHFSLATLGLPRVGVVKAVLCSSTGGTATQLNPDMGYAAGNADIYAKGGLANTPVHFHPTTGLIWPCDGGLIYGQSNANGTATTITTYILIAEGADQ